MIPNGFWQINRQCQWSVRQRVYLPDRGSVNPARALNDVGRYIRPDRDRQILFVRYPGTIVEFMFPCMRLRQTSQGTIGKGGTDAGNLVEAPAHVMGSVPGHDQAVEIQDLGLQCS
jgi:hypothetical protein